MSDTLKLIQDQVRAHSVRISEHGRDELVADSIRLRDVLDGVNEARVVEDYPTYIKGPSVLCLQHDGTGRPIHVLWGIAAQNRRIATLITAYRPDHERWTDGFLKRKR